MRPFSGNRVGSTTVFALARLAWALCLPGFGFFLAGCHWLRGPDEGWIGHALHERTGHDPGPLVPLGRPYLPPSVNLDDGISEDEAVLLALFNNTAYQELLAEVGLAQADLIQAGVIGNPQLVCYPPNGPKQLEALIWVPLDAILLPRRIAAAKGNCARTTERLVQAGLDLMRDVRVAHAELILARDRLRLGEETAKLREHLASLADSRYRAGEASRLEAQTAQVDALRGRQEAIRFNFDVTVAQNRLRTLIGLAQTDQPWTISEPATLPSLEVNLDAVVEEAVQSRPDVCAPLWAAEAAQHRLHLAKVGQFGLSGGAGFKALGNNPFQVGPIVRVNLPILNWNQGATSRARAEIEQAHRAHEAARDRAAQEVRQAHALYVQARTDLAQWETKIRPTVEDVVRRSEKAYREGHTSLIFALEAMRQLFDTRVREAQLHADVRRSWFELERSTGRRILPPPPPPPPPPQRKPKRLEKQAPGAQPGLIDPLAYEDLQMTEISIRVKRPKP